MLACQLVIAVTQELPNTVSQIRVTAMLALNQDTWRECWAEHITIPLPHRAALAGHTHTVDTLTTRAPHKVFIVRSCYHLGAEQYHLASPDLW